MAKKIGDLTNIDNRTIITSKDIADWTGKEHFHVMRDIRDEISELGEKGLSIFGLSSYVNAQNKLQPCYVMGRKGVMQLALKYDSDSRYKCIEKLEELEKSQIPTVPKTYGEALLEAGRLALENEKLAIERDEAIKTKAHISDNKTATALGRVGGLVKSNNMLRDKLGESKRYATIRAVEARTGKSFAYRPLKNYCQKRGLPIKQVNDQVYGKLNVYPAEAWYAIYDVELRKLFADSE